MSGPAQWRSRNGKLLLAVRLTPKAARDSVDGIDSADGGGSPVIKARVRAVPEKGKANAALAALIADWLKVPKSAVTVAAGGKSRLKTVAIEGDAGTLTARLDALLHPPG